MQKAIAGLIYQFTSQTKRELTIEETLNYLMANPALSPLVRVWRDTGEVHLEQIDTATLDQLLGKTIEPEIQLKKLAELAVFLRYLVKNYRLKLVEAGSESFSQPRSGKKRKTKKRLAEEGLEPLGVKKATRRKHTGRVPFKRNMVDQFFHEQQSSLKQVMVRILVNDQLSAHATAIKISALTGKTVTCADIQNWAKAYGIDYKPGRKKNGPKTKKVHSRRIRKEQANGSDNPPVAPSRKTNQEPDLFDEIKGLQVAPAVKAKLKVLSGQCNGREPKSLGELLNLIDKDTTEIPYAAEQLGLSPVEYIRLRQNVVHPTGL